MDKKTIIKIVFTIYLTLGNLGFLYYLGHKSSDSSYFFGLSFITALEGDFFIRLIANFSFVIGSLLFFSVGAIIVQRIGLLKVIPFIGEEPHYISVINRIIQNTLEHSAIFLAFLLVNFHYNQPHFTPFLFIDLVRFFCFGRILFGVGYILGELLKFQALRSVGMILTMSCEGVLFLGAMGINVIDILKCSSGQL